VTKRIQYNRIRTVDQAHANSAAQLWRDAHEQPEQLEQQVGELLGLGSLDDHLGAAVNGYDVGAAIVDPAF